ncbi:MAG: hypothetical protein WCP11_01920 [Candidatus Saccharibacteria bacterium]
MGVKQSNPTISIILAVALVAAIGVVIYQGMSGGKTAASDAKALSISQWGVKGGYFGKNELKTSIDGKDLTLKSDASTKNSCDPDSFSKITKYEASDMIDDGSGSATKKVSDVFNEGSSAGEIKQIGDFYYIYTEAASPCVEGEDTDQANVDQTVVVNDTKEFFTSLEAL